MGEVRCCYCRCLFDDEVYALQLSWALEGHFSSAVLGNKLTNKQKLVYFFF